MANPVQPVPSLPFAKQTDVTYINTLVRALVVLLIDHARRINLSIPTDGTVVPTAPLPLWQVATVDLPAAADWEGAILYDSTANRVKFSDGATWTSM